MDAKLILSTFWVVLLAELGDKTQIAIFTMASAAPSRWSVLVGACLALVTSSVLAVLLADWIVKHVSLRWTQGAAGVVLVGMGLVYVVGAVRGSG